MSENKFGSGEGLINRRQETIDRRSGMDRRRGPGVRRSSDRISAEEGNMTDEQFEFIMSVDEYKRVNQRPFPTLTEIMEIFKALGYRKTAQPSLITEIDDTTDTDSNQ